MPFKEDDMFKKASLILWIALIFSTLTLAQPHVVMGSLRNSGGGNPAEGCVEFEAWMTLRPGEILTQVSDGCGYMDTLWFVNVGSFPTPPEDGQELNIRFRDICSAETLTISGTITLPGAEEYWGPFELIPEARDINLLTPNGGDHYYWDDPIVITWNSTGTVGNVKLEYSTNAGADWFPITLSTANDGIHNWTAPHVTSTLVLFKVSEVATPGLFDVSDGYTTINQEPGLRMDYPNGGESFLVGDDETIAWTTTGPVGTVELHISRDNGASWEFIQGGLAARGTHVWTVDLPVSDECLMRVREEADTLIMDISNTVFEIDTADIPVIDTIPPAAVIDLEVIEVEATRALLRWTSPGDDENVGTATQYVLGYDVIDFIWPPSFFAAGLPAPLIAGTVQETWVEGLIPGTEYWAAMVTHDEVPNESDVSNYVNFTTPVVPDTTPPAAFVIDTIPATREVSDDGFTIHWLAPGDDGNVGTADHYEFRWSAVAFTEEFFGAQALITTGVPDPLPAGTPQTLTVEGLTPETDYWIAGKAWDDEGLDGPVSNILHIRTHEYEDDVPPGIILDLTCGDLGPTSIELVFTAPGDDGATGTVGVGYEIRYKPDVDFDPIDYIFTAVYDTIDPVVGGTEVRYNITGLDRGREYYFTIRPLDNDGPDGEPCPTTGCWTLGVVNPIPDLTMMEDDPDTALPMLSDVFNPPYGLIYDVESTEEGIIATLVDSEYVNISLAPHYHGEGWVIITAREGDDVLVDSVYVTVISVNDPPVFISFPADTLILDGFPWNYLAVATDADGDVVTYELYMGPVGMEVDVSGYCSWLPVDVEGTYTVQIAAFDDVDTTIQAFNVVVIKETHPVFEPQNLVALDGFRGCIPLMWQAPPAVMTGLPVTLSHYRVHRSEFFDVGYSMIADSVVYNSYADNTVDPGRLYFYKVQAVYHDPDFNSGFSNIDGGASLEGDLLYSNYFTGDKPTLDGNTNEVVWFEAIRAELSPDAHVLFMNDLSTLYFGMDVMMTLYDGYTLRFFFDDDYSRSWDDADSSTEGYYEVEYETGVGATVWFYPVGEDSAEVERISTGGFAAFEPIAPGYFSFEMFIDMTVPEEFLALPSDTVGIGIQILNEVGDTVFEWPIAADFLDPTDFGTLLLGAPGGIPTLTVSPPILSVDLEEGWTTTADVTLRNHGTGTAVWYLTEDADWLEMSDEWGIVPPGASRTLTAYFEAGTLGVGTYNSLIEFTTNDPIAPEKELPVEFEVTPRVPAHYLNVYPPEETMANPGALIQVPISLGSTYTNEITTIDFMVRADSDFLSPLNVTRGTGLPSDWTLVIRNIGTDRVLVRLIGPTPITGPTELIKVHYVVSPDLLLGRSCRIEVDDLLFNYGMEFLPIPVADAGIFIVGEDIRFFWYGMLRYFDSSWEKQDSLKLGLLDAATNDFDRGIDVLNTPPWYGYSDAWFLSDDWKKLGTDIRPTGQIVEWFAYFEEGGYLSWDPDQMWDGLLINDWLDMTQDSFIEITPETPIKITYDARPGMHRWEIDLVTGWNLLSAPITTPSMTPSALFPGAVSVWGWNNAIQEYQPVTEVVPGRAVWVLSFIDTSYVRTGDPVYNFDRGLSVGWVMLGSPAHRTYLSDQQITPSDAFMFGTFYYYETDGMPRYETTDQFVPGRGQWIFNQRPSNARITSIYLPKAAIDDEIEPVAGGRLFFADESGIGVRFNMVENPLSKPMPPAIPGAMDRIFIDGDMPMLTGEIAPAQKGEWTGVVSVTKARRIEWTTEGKGDFTITIGEDAYNMGETHGVDLQPGTYTFKVSVDRSLPDKLTLYPNAPNPFNAATEIRFAIPEDTEISLEIYDITGRNVRKLMEDKADAGYHRVLWDGYSDSNRELPSGIYFAVLKAGQTSAKQKLLMIK